MHWNFFMVLLTGLLFCTNVHAEFNPRGGVGSMFGDSFVHRFGSMENKLQMCSLSIGDGEKIEAMAKEIREFYKDSPLAHSPLMDRRPNHAMADFSGSRAEINFDIKRASNNALVLNVAGPGVSSDIPLTETKETASGYEFTFSGSGRRDRFNVTLVFSWNTSTDTVDVVKAVLEPKRF